MKLKIIYLILFICIIWLGMTKTGRDLISLSTQTESYTNKHNEYTIRFFGKTIPPLAATIKPAKLGLIVNPGQLASMDFTISNMSSEVQTIKISEEITPELHKSLLKLHPIDMITLAPKSHHVVKTQFTLDANISRELDTLYLKLNIQTL